jgi:hypothetical protein
MDRWTGSIVEFQQGRCHIRLLSSMLIKFLMGWQGALPHGRRLHSSICLRQGS